jgi:hypothetical protein
MELKKIKVYLKEKLCLFLRGHIYYCPICKEPAVSTAKTPLIKRFGSCSMLVCSNCSNEAKKINNKKILKKIKKAKKEKRLIIGQCPDNIKKTYGSFYPEAIITFERGKEGKTYLEMKKGSKNNFIEKLLKNQTEEWN